MLLNRHMTRAVRGRFLMLFSHGTSKEVRALVRVATLKQIGHYCGGFVVVKSPHAREANNPPGRRGRLRVKDGQFVLFVEGAYGNNGLPISAEDYPGIWSLLHDLPPGLVEKFWKGGGWNSAGTEGPEMRAWALENLRALTKLKEPK